MYAQMARAHMGNSETVNSKSTNTNLREFACHTTVILAQPRVSRLRVAVSDAFHRARRKGRASAGEIAGCFAWGWRKSGVPESNSHAASWPRCRHVRTVLPFWLRACNSHKDSWPQSRHAGPQSRHVRTVSLFWVAACNSHKDSGPQSRHVRTSTRRGTVTLHFLYIQTPDRPPQRLLC